MSDAAAALDAGPFDLGGRGEGGDAALCLHGLTGTPYEVRPITIETDLGFDFETDIQYGTWMFRPRSPKQPGMMRWCRERGLEAGDTIVFEKTGERTYRLSLEKAAKA